MTTAVDDLLTELPANNQPKPGNCTILPFCKILVETSEGNYCSFCYEICKKATPKYSSVVFDVNSANNPSAKCSCGHDESGKFFENTFFDVIDHYKDQTLRQQIAFNQFLSYKRDNRNIMEIMLPEYCEEVAKDFENLQNQTFNWDFIEVPKITSRANDINDFLVKWEIPALRLPFVNTEPFHKIITLKFLDLIVEHPDYTFGQPIYNNSLNYYTYLLSFFLKFYLKKDLLTLDLIDAEDIETYSPLSRHYIRANNQKNAEILKKYFNDEFNLVKFAIKLVDKFVVGATWRWIGAYHKAHVYSIEICKLIVEYGIASEEECDEIRRALYLKVQVYRSLENIIDRDSATIAEKWVTIWFEGLRDVREFYIEILINQLYFKQDNDVVAILLRFYRENAKNAVKTEEQMKNIVKFNDSVLFEEEFARKTMDFLLNYILSQNQIAKKLITSRKIEGIADNFLHIFSNVDDPYLHSLKLIREEDYLNFVRLENSEFGPRNFIQQDFFDFANDLKVIREKISKGAYLYREIHVIQELEAVLDKINQKIGFVKANQNNEPRDFITQRLLSNANLHFLFQNIMSNLMQFSESLVENNSEKLLTKFKGFLEFYLKNNPESQSSFFSEKKFLGLEDMFYKFPSVITDLLLDTFNKNPQILVSKEYILDILLDMFKKQLEKKKDALTIQDYDYLSKLLDVISLYLDLSCFKIFNWIPEYDIRIAESLANHKDFFAVAELERLLQSYEGNPKVLDDAKLDFIMNLLSLLRNSTAYRYTDDLYKKMDESFPMDSLINLINLSKNNLNFRTIFFELYANFHIDFKNHLINNRSNYYFTKPADMQYEEDPFFDKFYDKTIDLFVTELKFIIEEHMNLKKMSSSMFSDYLTSTIFCSLIKLMNYFLVIRDGDLHKLSKYIAKLAELNDFLFSNRFVINGIYGVIDNEFDSPERKNMELELSKIDKNFKIKLDRTQIIGHCKAIIAMCREIIKRLEVVAAKKPLISQKSTISRINETYLKTLNFSNRLQIRRENLKFPFDKLFKKQEKRKENRINIIRSIVAFYEHFKMTKVSTDSSKNIYLNALNEDSPEMQIYSYNLCSFIHNQLNSEWKLDEKNKKYTLIESLCHALFVATHSIQNNLFKVMKEQGEKSQEALDKVWVEMKYILTLVKFKTNIDKFWKEAFRRAVLLMKFHQFLCEDNCNDFKQFMREQKLPNDTIDRLQRWTTIFQRASDNFQWHYNYTKGEINDFQNSHRPHLLQIATSCFENLAELCTGPNTENQKKIFTYIYDRYNGFLRRYWRDCDSEFYKAKLALIDFMLSMIEGMDPDIINYHTTNFELVNINTVMIDSLKQLFYCVGKKDPFDKKKMSDYPLEMKQYKEILAQFETNQRFANHPLLNICLKLMGYIRTIAEVKSKYQLYIKEREDLMYRYQRTGEVKSKTISEEDLVTFQFLQKILTKIEVKRVHEYNEIVIFYHFAVLSKCLYLSDESKRAFLKNVDRTNQGTKISGLLANLEYFQIEMENNEERFNKYYLVYKIFGSGGLARSELICWVISFINNILMLVDLQYIHESNSILFDGKYSLTVLALGFIEIILSILAIVGYLFLNYSFEKKIARKKYLQHHADIEKLNKYENFYVNYWVALFSKKKIYIYLYHILFVALGLTTSYGFMGIDLFAIIFYFPSMRYIVKSVTLHLNHILYTLLLAAVVIYVYSIFAHFYFQEYFISDLVNECDNLSHCFFTVLNIAFRNGEGIGGLLTLAYYGKAGGDPRFYGSLFFDISFFLIINTVLLNIILAILVDTFSELRQRSDAFNEDSQNICFICGIEKYNFEKSGIDFDKHVAVEHNIWDYVNFLIFMRNKTEKDCNGIEDEIFHKIKSGDQSWFPQGRSMSLEKVKSFEITVSLDYIAEKIDRNKDLLEKIYKTSAKA